ncbi:MAG: BolA family protein [Rhodospirillaceae bacterium]
MTDTPYRDRLSEKITAGLAPVQLEIKDDSHKHSGHADRIAALAVPGKSHADSGGETHFRVTVVSDRFEGLSRVARQRLVYDLVQEELKERVHSLALVTKTPAEVGLA